MSVQDTLDFDPQRIHSIGQADTRPAPGPSVGEVLIGATVTVAALFFVLLVARKIRAANLSRSRWSALLIAAGLTVLAFDLFVAAHFRPIAAVRALHREGWIAFFGAATFAIGLYYRMTMRPPDKI